MNVAVVGAGSWGTALARVAALAGRAVRLWARDPAIAQAIESRRENELYLPGVELPAAVRATAELGEALDGAALIVWVVPSHGTRQVAERAAAHVVPGAIVASATKGIEQDTLATMEEVLGQVLPAGTRRAVLSGPSFAREVARDVPTAEVAAAVQRALATDRFRVYTGDDPIGAELGGAFKNVIALATGIADGLGFGHNTRAALITRGLAEIARVAVRKGAHPLTLAGLAGMGDLVLTCTGELSRNRTVGLELGRGRPLHEILAEMRMVAEGVNTARSGRALGQALGVELPITDVVYRILYERFSPRDAVELLMRRELRAER